MASIMILQNMVSAPATAQGRGIAAPLTCQKCQPNMAASWRRRGENILPLNTSLLGSPYEAVVLGSYGFLPTGLLGLV